MRRWQTIIVSAIFCGAPLTDALADKLTVTRKSQDFYEVLEGRFYIQTRACYEYVYYTPAVVSGSDLIFLETGKTCQIQRILR